MSRCFPFPPPGYEKKPTIRPEEGDSLKEEKKKEKKHKKEKKDKEKREGKEKKDKDRSDEKHKEKKEKKDKHKDKKEKHKDKKKEKDKDKDKNSISSEARVAFLSGASSGVVRHETDEHKDRQTSSEKGRDEHKDRPTSSGKGRDELNGRHISSEKGKHPNQIHIQHGEKPFKTSSFAVEAEDSKFVQELGRRIRDEEKGAQSQSAERFPVEWKRDEKTGRVGISDEEKRAQSQSAERFPVEWKRDEKTGRVGFSDEEKRAQSQSAERFPVEWKRDEKTGRVGIKDSGNLAADKEKNKEKGVHNNKMDVQAFRGELKIAANAIHPNLSTVAKIKFEGIPRPLEENFEKTREEKQKPKERRDDKPREKHKDKEREKQSHAKKKDKEKEKKKEEKAKDKSEHKKSREDKSRDINKNDFVGLSNNELPLVSKEIIAGTVTEGITRKRKDVETNGFLHESEVRPAKLLRPSSSQQPTQNGKKLDTHQKADLFSPNKQLAATDLQTKEHKVNGSIEGQPLSSAKAKASCIIPGADHIAEASKRPPHPDSKYLSQILSVPTMDDWSGFDDQEWLLGSERTPAKKADSCPDEASKDHWALSALQKRPSGILRPVQGFRLDSFSPLYL